jgi:hypothetical protein
MRFINLKQIIALTILVTTLSAFETEACGLIDEVGPLVQLKAELGEHLSATNDDTRFVIDRNDTGAFSIINNIGSIHHPSQATAPKGGRKGATAIVLNGCYAITNYHVVEGHSIITTPSQMPEEGKKVKFSYGAIKGQTQGFRYSEIDATVVDPKILNLNNRRWSDDIVLIKFSKKLPTDSYKKIKLESIASKSVEIDDATNFQEQFFVAAGIPVEKYNDYDDANVYGDFCNPKGYHSSVGIRTNCVLTTGMSGGGLFMFNKLPGRNQYETSLIGMNIQPASGSGHFVKGDEQRSSFVAPLTSDKISKIQSFTEQKLDENCN